MEDKNKFSFNLKLISITLKLNKLEYDSIYNIASIFDLDNNIPDKKSLINKIIDYLKKFNYNELINFENEIKLNISPNKVDNLPNDNQKVENDLNKDKDEEDNLSLELSSINNNIDCLNINNNKYKRKRTYNEMLIENKIDDPNINKDIIKINSKIKKNKN